MNTFFSSTFIKEDSLKEARIYHPIKLEYYKHTNEVEDQVKFGINIIQKEYQKEGLKVENQEFKELTDNEQEIEKLLNFLERNEVMPVHVVDVLKDIEEDKNSEFNITIHKLSNS